MVGDMDMADAAGILGDPGLDADGTRQPDFVLNQDAYADVALLVANANFGCGSAREGAVYALVDHGGCCAELR